VIQLAGSSAHIRAVALFKVAVFDEKSSNYEEAERHVREAIQIEPRALNHHAVLSEALRHQGRIQEADDQMRIEEDIKKQFLQERLAARQKSNRAN